MFFHTFLKERQTVKTMWCLCNTHVDLRSTLTLKIAYLLLLFSQVNLVRESGICLFVRLMYRWNQWLWMYLQSWFCWFAVRRRRRRMSSSVLRKWFVETLTYKLKVLCTVVFKVESLGPYMKVTIQIIGLPGSNCLAIFQAWFK